MKEKRLIIEEEKEILLNTKIKSDWSLGRLFYIMALLLPFLVCMIITRYYAYLYIFIALLALFLFVVLIYPRLFKRYIKNNNNIYVYESNVLSCRSHDFYYYQLEIEDINGDFLDYRFPVSKKLNKDNTLIVVMVMGEKKYSKYYLLDKDTKEVLTSKRSRFDLID